MSHNQSIIVHGLSTAAEDSFRAKAEAQSLPEPQHQIPLTPAAVEQRLIREMSSYYRPQLPIWSFTTQSSPTLYFYRDVENMLRDGVVTIPLQYFIAPLSFAEFNIQASSQAVADWAMEQLKWFWDNMYHLQWWGYAYGWSGAEVVYGIEDDLLVQKSLNVFHPRDVRPLTINRQYCGVRVSQGSDQGHIDLWGSQKGVPAKAFWYAHNQQFNRLFGTSQISPAWRYWTRLVAKDGVEEICDMGTYRLGVGAVVVRYPSEDIRANATGRPAWSSDRSSARQIALSLAEGIKAGANIVLPSESWPDRGEYKWDLKFEAPSVNIQQLSDREKDLRRKISDHIGWPSELFEQADGGGGFSGRRMPFISLLLRQNTIAQCITNAWVSQIGLPAARWNFGAKAWLKIKPVSLVEIFTKLNNGQQMAPGQGQAGAQPIPPTQAPPPASEKREALPPADMKTLFYSFLQEMAAAKNGDPQAAQSASLIRDQIRAISPPKAPKKLLSTAMITMATKKANSGSNKQYPVLDKKIADLEADIRRGASKQPKAISQIEEAAKNGTLKPEAMAEFVEMISSPEHQDKFTGDHLFQLTRRIGDFKSFSEREGDLARRGREHIASTRQQVLNGKASQEPITVGPVSLEDLERKQDVQAIDLSGDSDATTDDSGLDVEAMRRIREIEGLDSPSQYPPVKAIPLENLPQSPQPDRSNQTGPSHYPPVEPIPLDQLPQSGQSQYPPVQPIPLDQLPQSPQPVKGQVPTQKNQVNTDTFSPQQNTPKDRMAASGQDATTQSPESIMQAQANEQQAGKIPTPTDQLTTPAPQPTPQPTLPPYQPQGSKKERKNRQYQPPVSQQDKQPITQTVAPVHQPYQPAPKTSGQYQPPATQQQQPVQSVPTQQSYQPAPKTQGDYQPPVGQQPQVQQQAVPAQQQPIQTPQVAQLPPYQPQGTKKERKGRQYQPPVQRQANATVTNQLVESNEGQPKKEPEFSDPTTTERYKNNEANIADLEAYFERYKGKEPNEGDVAYQPFQDRKRALEGALGVRERLLKANNQSQNNPSDILPGGKGDKIKTSSLPKSTLAKGAKVEMEHTNNPKLAVEIAKDHLAESPQYYDDLAKMEVKEKQSGEDNPPVGELLVGTEEEQNAKEKAIRAKMDKQKQEKKISTKGQLTPAQQEKLDALDKKRAEKVLASITSEQKQKLAEAYKNYLFFLKQHQADNNPDAEFDAQADARLTDSTLKIAKGLFATEDKPTDVPEQKAEAIIDPVQSEATKLKTILQKHLNPDAYSADDVNKIIEHFSKKKLPEIQAILKAAGVELAARTKAGILKKLFLRLNAARTAITRSEV